MHSEPTVAQRKFAARRPTKHKVEMPEGQEDKPEERRKLERVMSQRREALVTSRSTIRVGAKNDPHIFVKQAHMKLTLGGLESRMKRSHLIHRQGIFVITDTHFYFLCYHFELDEDVLTDTVVVHFDEYQGYPFVEAPEMAGKDLGWQTTDEANKWLTQMFVDTVKSETEAMKEHGRPHSMRIPLADIARVKIGRVDGVKLTLREGEYLGHNGKPGKSLHFGLGDMLSTRSKLRMIKGSSIAKFLKQQSVKVSTSTF